MKRTVQQGISSRAVTDDQLEEWVKKEANPTLAGLYNFANQRYSTNPAKTTAATATYTNVWSDTMPDNSSWIVDVHVVARATGGGAGRAAYKLSALFFREAGGVATQQGATVTLVSIESVAGFDVRYAVSVNDVQVQVLDDGARTVAWDAVIQVQEATR